MIQSFLEELGLTKGEVKVYSALVFINKSTKIGEIIKKSEVSGSKTYEILDKLISKGLVSYIFKDKIKYFSATDPERILDYIEEKEDKIKVLKKEAHEKIFEMKKSQPKESLKNEKTTVFQGFRGFKNAYNLSKENVKVGDTVFGMFIPEVHPNALAFYKHYIEDFSKRFKVRNLLLFNHRVPEIDLVKNIPGVEVRILSKGIHAPTEISIHNNNVLITTSAGEEFQVVMISNRDVATSFKEYFYSIWNQSEKISKKEPLK